MSVAVETKRVTVPEIRAHKNAKPVVCLTCYHAHTARLLDEHVDLMLVGDSLGNGDARAWRTRLGVTLDMMIVARQGGDARLEACARRRRHAVRLL